MVKAVIFDCFGVIISDGLEAVLLRLKATDPAAREHVGSIMAANNRGILSPDEADGQVATYLHISVEEWRSQIAAGEYKNPDVVGWVRQLRASYKTAMLSNLGKDSMRRRFTDSELQGLFDEVVISGEVGMAKPDPAIYSLVAERLGIAPAECLFVDDRVGYCRAAEALGMQTVVFGSLEQARADVARLLANPEE